jgi:hypothetical protein
MRKKAANLQVGDRRISIFGAQEITSIEREDGWVKCWLDHQFVPASYRPGETVEIRSDPPSLHDDRVDRYPGSYADEGLIAEYEHE